MASEADCKALHDKFLLLHTVEQQSLGQADAGVSGVQRACIVGAGNGSHVMAALLASKGISVSIYATRPQHVEKFEKDGLEVSAFYPSENRTVTGTVSVVTTDPEEAAKGADLVMMCLPTFLHDSVLRALVPFLRPGTPVGAVKGGWWTKPPLPGMAAMNFFVMETLPWACRVEKGHTATVLGTKVCVRMGSSPASEAPRLCSLMSKLLDINFRPVANMLGSCTFFPGFVLHPGIMYGLLSEWDGKAFEKAPLFYQGVDDRTEEVMLGLQADMDRTKAKLQELLPSMDLSSVGTVHDWLLDAYDGQIGDLSTLGSTLRTNAAYAGLVVPTRPNPDGPGRLPLFDYRYLTEDAEIHFTVIRGIAELLGVPTPTVDRVLEWAQAKLNREWLREGKLQGKDLARTRAPQAFGIRSVEAFLQSMQ
jgi:hypothetical protein